MFFIRRVDAASVARDIYDARPCHVDAGACRYLPFVFTRRHAASMLSFRQRLAAVAMPLFRHGFMPLIDAFAVVCYAVVDDDGYVVSLRRCCCLLHAALTVSRYDATPRSSLMPDLFSCLLLIEITSCRLSVAY